ncbi:hypothetical protein [Epilithonimonas sp.]|uniref:hypothetical protein n=1 Tax=Epilithonimonas sp. TaxID=2894511 RepID=UPI00289D1371|nr:hypothetical protein [Epilithonimonas sp.]
MEIRISLDEYADIPFIKKLLSQIKGVKNVEIAEDEIADEEYSNLLNKVLEKSIQQADKGEIRELTPELLNEIFK